MFDKHSMCETGKIFLEEGETYYEPKQKFAG